jgi:hypothetical protein
MNMPSEEPRVLSEVVPLLVAVLICDVAVVDPGSGKKNLIGIFDRINVGTFPARRPMFVYFKITDAEGLYEMRVRYLHRDTNELLAEAQGELRATDRLASIDGIIGFPPLSIPREGRYEVQVLANSVYLGSTFVSTKTKG